MAEQRAQRRLAAILAADVVDYSRLMEADEVGTMAALKLRRRNVLDPLVAKHQGRIFKTTGDGVLVEFSSAVNAVQCAVELQQGMAAANAGQPDDRDIVLRIGVNLGDVLVEGSDLYGDGVNIAARLESIAEPDGIVVSGTAYDHIKNNIKVGFDDLGSQTLKNIVEPVRAYRVTGTPVVKITPHKTTTDKPSVAVLPFTNMSSDAEQQYFSDGVTEDIITELSRFRSLFVIARNSSFQYRDKASDVRRIARELGVQYVVEGSVRKGGERLRITAQLIDAKTGNHLLAERYDRSLAEVFVVQDAVVQAIVARIAGQLAAAESEKALRKRTDHLGAYDCYLRGLDCWRGAGPDADARSNTWFEKALELDPAYAEPLALLCISTTLLACYNDSNHRFDRALAMGNKAVALDPNNSWSHCALGVATLASGSVAASAAHFETAMQLNPNDPDQMIWCSSYHMYSGNFVAAYEMIAAAGRLNPLNPPWYKKNRAMVEYGFHHYGDSAQLLESLESSDYHLWDHCYLAACYVQLGKMPEAKEEIAKALRMKPSLNINELATLEMYTRREDLEHLLEPVRKAGLPD